jgi:CheY-like chemotaxis protein
MVRAMLARHRVVTATSGEEALEHLATQSFDLVISDLGMGAGMNGWELAQRVKHEWPGVRFVLATGWGATISEEEARERGVEAVMTKPFSVRQLWQVIEASPEALTL